MKSLIIGLFLIGAIEASGAGVPCTLEIGKFPPGGSQEIIEPEIIFKKEIYLDAETGTEFEENIVSTALAVGVALDQIKPGGWGNLSLHLSRALQGGKSETIAHAALVVRKVNNAAVVVNTQQYVVALSCQ